MYNRCFIKQDFISFGETRKTGQTGGRGAKQHLQVLKFKMSSINLTDLYWALIN